MKLFATALLVGLGATGLVPYAPPAPVPAPRSRVLSVDDRELLRVAEPEGARAAAPVTVMLHGLCNDNQVTCEWLLPGEIAPQWQVCPQGNVACGGAFNQWGGSSEAKRRVVSDAIARLMDEYPERVLGEAPVLVGYSQGAYAAAEIVRSGYVWFTGLVLVGANVELSVDELSRAGIKRVVFAAGELDGARPTLERAAASLARRGFAARYVSLGKVGHFVPQETSAIVGEAIDWARGG